MDPKFVLGPVIAGVVVGLAAGFYIKTQKAQIITLTDGQVALEHAKEGAEGKAASAEKALKAATDSEAADKKALTDANAQVSKLGIEKKTAEAALADAQAKVTSTQSALDALQKSAGESAKAYQDQSAQFETAKKNLSDALAQKKQAEDKLKSLQADYNSAKAIADASKQSNFLTMQYKADPDAVRNQVNQLVKDVPELAAKLGVAGGGGGDGLRADVAQRMVTVNLEGAFTYGDGDAKKTETLSWPVGGVVIGMDANQVYVLATPQPHMMDQPAAVNTLTKNCTLQFSISPPGWVGVKEPLPAVLLGVLRGPGNAAVAVLAASVADWPQGREKPIGLIPAPTVQECRQWSVDGDVGFVYSRGIPASAGAGPVKIETPIRVGETQVAVVMPAQATGYELGLFGTYKAPSDKSVLGVYYPEGNRILWLSDLYNGAKAMVGDIAKLNDVGASYVGSDWVVQLGERKNLRGVDAIGADFVTFLEKR